MVLQGLCGSVRAPGRRVVCVVVCGPFSTVRMLPGWVEVRGYASFRTIKQRPRDLSGMHGVYIIQSDSKETNGVVRHARVAHRLQNESQRRRETPLNVFCSF